MNINRLRSTKSNGYLNGQMLLAMPNLGSAKAGDKGNDGFYKSVVYIVSHSSSGALGLIINRRARNIAFPELLVQLDLIGEDDAIRLPQHIEKIPVLHGGPLAGGRGFMLHSPDVFLSEASMALSDSVALTLTVDILKAIVRNEGPKSALLALGHAGWSEGQLEAEMKHNSWINCPLDEALLFDQDYDTKYERALKNLGIDPMMLSNDYGHA